MPWCEPCGRYLTPSSVDTSGSCPSCGGDVEPAPDTDHAAQKIPWHFWLIAVLTALYLGWRAVQGITLLF